MLMNNKTKTKKKTHHISSNNINISIYKCNQAIIPDQWKNSTEIYIDIYYAMDYPKMV